MNKILPVFLPFESCGNRCIFCDQTAITNKAEKPDILKYTIKQIEQWLTYSSNWDEIAFFGGNFGAINKDKRIKLYNIAKNYKLNNIRFSTRPDTISSTLIEEIQEFNIKTVELGVQSLSEVTLNKNCRPYSQEDVLNAIDNISKVSNCGVQVMNGMYFQDQVSAIEDSKKLSEYNIKYARIYPTQVFPNTKLAKYLTLGLYTPQKLSDAILISTGQYLNFIYKQINVIRIGLPEGNKQTSIAGTKHNAFGDLVKTFVILLYLAKGKNIFGRKEKVGYFSGYKGLCKKLFKNQFISDNNKTTKFIDICIDVRRDYLENSKRYIKGEATKFASKLESEAYNR